MLTAVALSSREGGWGVEGRGKGEGRWARGEKGM